METTGSGWQNDPEVRRRRDEQLRREQLATYGFQNVPEAEKVSRVRRHFNSVADSYDFMNTVLSLGIHLIWKRMAVNQLQLKPGQQVLDVCGGTGDLAVLAAGKVGRSGRVLLYDINRDMIEAGRRKNSHVKASAGIDYVQGDAEHIAMPDSSFDAAMVGFGIRNLTRMEAGFREMHRVLKPGGRMMCLEFSKPVSPVFRWIYDCYSFTLMPLLGQALAGSRQAYTHLPETIRLFPLPHELSALLNRIGFEPVTYRRLTNGIAVIHMATKP